MKVFISQKFRDLTEEEILKRRNMIIEGIKNEFKVVNIEIIENWHPHFDKNSIGQLGESIIEMSEADLVLISGTSLENIEAYKRLGRTHMLKGSEMEVLICKSYDIPYRVYDFKYEECGNALTPAKSIRFL